MEGNAQTLFLEETAVVKRIRYLLEQQQEVFQKYLRVLEKQELKIIAEDTEAMFVHTQIAQQLLNKIQSLQKVLNPLQSVYQNISVPLQASSDIINAQNTINILQQKASIQNKKNQALLHKHMQLLKHRIESLHNPYKSTRSIYARQDSNGIIIQIEA